MIEDEDDDEWGEEVNASDVADRDPFRTQEEFVAKSVKSGPQFAKARWLAKKKVREQGDTPLGRLCGHLLNNSIGPTLDQARKIAGLPNEKDWLEFTERIEPPLYFDSQYQVLKLGLDKTRKT